MSIDDKDGNILDIYQTIINARKRELNDGRGGEEQEKSLKIDILKELIYERYKIVGGRIRLLLFDCDNKVLEKEVKNAMMSTDLDTLRRIDELVVSGSTKSIGYSIVAENDSVYDYKTMFSSIYAQKCAVLSIRKACKHKNLDLFSMLDNSNARSGLAGSMFEKFAEEVFENGGVFNITLMHGAPGDGRSSNTIKEEVKEQITKVETAISKKIFPSRILRNFGVDSILANIQTLENALSECKQFMIEKKRGISYCCDISVYTF